jgi:hypothetical protein
MKSHNQRSVSEVAMLDPTQNPSTSITPETPKEGSVAIEAAPKGPASDLAPAQMDAAPIAPSQRLPLIAHTLREARVAIAELRYEGRGGMGGFITEFHDRHRLKSLSQAIDQRMAQQLTGFLWQLVLRRNPSWSENSGSFGVVTWDLNSDLIRHVHHQRIVDVKTSLIEGL